MQIKKNKMKKKQSYYFDIIVQVCDNCNNEFDENLLYVFGESYFCEDCKKNINNFIFEFSEISEPIIKLKINNKINKHKACESFRKWLVLEVRKHDNDAKTFDSFNVEQFQIAIDLVKELKAELVRKNILI